MAEGTLAQAIEIYRQFQLTRYTAVSAWAWLIYDMMLTFRLEVKHIWRRDFTLPQALYCFIRYYAIAYISYLCIISLTPGLSVRSCDAFFKTEAFGMPIFSLGVNALLVLRLHAIYHSRKVTLVLAALLIAQTTLSLVITAQAALSAHALPAPPEVRRWPGCFSEKLDRSPRFTSTAWAVALVVDSIFFAMTLYKLWKLRVSGVRVSGIITVFARDGAMFFGMIFGTTPVAWLICLLTAFAFCARAALELANTLINALEPIGPLIGAGSPWIIAGWGIAASRLVLNLREYSDRDHGFSYGSAGATLRGGTHTRSRVTSGLELEFRHGGPGGTMSTLGWEMPVPTAVHV